jgi:hypothetical protein
LDFGSHQTISCQKLSGLLREAQLIFDLMMAIGQDDIALVCGSQMLLTWLQNSIQTYGVCHLSPLPHATVYGCRADLIKDKDDGTKTGLSQVSETFIGLKTLDYVDSSATEPCVWSLLVFFTSSRLVSCDPLKEMLRNLVHINLTRRQKPSETPTSEFPAAPGVSIPFRIPYFSRSAILIIPTGFNCRDASRPKAVNYQGRECFYSKTAGKFRTFCSYTNP